MMTQMYAQPQYQMQGQYPAQGAQKQSNPFWYRENASYLYGVTNAPSNLNLGIEDISLKPASANQQQYGILMNGYLRTVVGGISFQIRRSKSNAPFVQTVTTAINKDKGEYWEHINLKPQVKAQILRFFEALQGGHAHAPQQPAYGANPYGAQAPQQPMQGNPAMDPNAMMLMMQQLLQQQQAMANQPPASYTPPAQAEAQANISSEGIGTEEFLDVENEEVPI